MLIAKCKKGIHFPQSDDKVNTVFMLIGSRNERNFHLRVLSVIAQIVQDKDFKRKWMLAPDNQSLKDILLLTKRTR
jgi:mannitol/fructose-specific phosphotransferase system IIA component (Ntr-type)